MTAGTAVFESGQDALNDVGLVEGHAYTLIAGYEIYHKNQTIKLIKLRNPWGNEVFFYLIYNFYLQIKLNNICIYLLKYLKKKRNEKVSFLIIH